MPIMAVSKIGGGITTKMGMGKNGASPIFAHAILAVLLMKKISNVQEWAQRVLPLEH